MHPIAAVQTEYSLWTRNPEIAVLDACRELGAAFVAFSPVARGFLAARCTTSRTLDAKDIRRRMPRFAPANYAANLQLLPAYKALARRRPAARRPSWRWPGCCTRRRTSSRSPARPAWRICSEDLGAADVQLDAGRLARLEALINQRTVTGPRYSAQSRSEVDTEEFSD